MTPAPAAPLPPREAYRLWAASYDGENVVSALDERAVEILTPSLDGLALLDAACGTARRLRFPQDEGPVLAVGVDLVLEMLLAARADPSRSRKLAAGDLRSLPLASGAFDVAWCRLAAGHLAELAPLYAELSRVVQPGGAVVVTDFHPEAVRRGHVRSFRDTSGAWRLVEHTVHEAADHEACARDAGLEFEARLEASVGRDAKPFYESAGGLDRYERDLGLPLVVAYRFRAGGRP